MKNFPFKAINPDTGKEQEFWHSRSMAATIFVFAYNSDNELCVLANKRGPGCPDYVGYWVCPCGYLDYNETLEQAARRECKEETGVELPEEMPLVFMGYIDDPKENHQNVTFQFTVLLDNTLETSNKGNEEDETTSIKWIPIHEIDNYDWAFGHRDYIAQALYEYRV